MHEDAFLIKCRNHLIRGIGMRRHLYVEVIINFEVLLRSHLPADKYAWLSIKANVISIT